MSKIKSKKNYLVIFFILISFFLLLISFFLNKSTLTTNSKAADNKPFIPVFYNGDRNEKLIALTIDDCHLTEITKATNIYPQQVPCRTVFETLKKLNIPATFFPVGSAMKDNIYNKDYSSSKLFKDMLSYRKNGKIFFELQNHTYSHTFKADSSKEDIKKDILDWQSAYNALGMGDWGNSTSKFFRPPGLSAINNNNLYAVAYELKIAGVAWCDACSSRSTRPNETSDEIANEINENLKNGSIILIHSIKQDIDALPKIQKYAQIKDLKFVLLSELPGIPGYKEKKGKPVLKKEGKLKKNY